MTDLYIISGFLGAGKTTLIQTMASSVFQGQKIVVIENDFGEAGIDASFLTSCEITVTSMNAGCICCSMSGDFYKAIGQIVKEYQPDVILVEPSGVGKLSDIVKACLKQKELVEIKRCITVVDIRTFDKYRENYGEFFVDQIRYGDLILISHLEGKSGEIEETLRKIRECNQEARIEADFWDSIPAEVFRTGERVEAVKELYEESLKTPKISHLLSAVSSPFRFAREVFSSVTLTCDDSLTKEELRLKLEHVIQQADGMILRGKGIVGCNEGNFLFHYIPGKFQLEPSQAEGNKICFIGTGIKKEQIKSLFEGKL
ncbi:CobW family GTP-binding protein [Lacrimispora aerotolerans]|uniref:CobW family GTP-binding protein n=1 Tax=Lacrimispora aerotolerans TaxID=36832 RepID=UPI00047B4C7C|nr:GTP-binding protein [Lacrimispora aerotolerans]